MKIKLWLQLFRAQTAPATVYTFIVPYLLAGGRDPVTITVLFFLGTLAHYFSFGHNSLMDYWYDLHDPNKRHHPLIAGELKLEDAHKVIHYGMILTTIALIVLTILVSPVPALALSFLMGYIVFGHAYNDGLDKNSTHSWIPISLCFTSLTLYSWFLASTVFNVFTLMVALWAFLTIFYQIAWEGNLKDLWNPAEKNNLLWKVGTTMTRVENGWEICVPRWIDKFMFYIRASGNSLLIVMLAYFTPASLLNRLLFTLAFIPTTILEIWNVHEIHYLLSRNIICGIVDRDQLLEYFGKAEAIAFFQFMTLLILHGLWHVYLILLFYGLVYFVLMNRVLWGSRFGPRV